VRLQTENRVDGGDVAVGARVYKKRPAGGVLVAQRDWTALTFAA
jgi:hypothetical protein